MRLSRELKAPLLLLAATVVGPPLLGVVVGPLAAVWSLALLGSIVVAWNLAILAGLLREALIFLGHYVSRQF